MNVGIFTYDRYHAKTAELAHRLRNTHDLGLIEIPFKARKPRSPKINHRPAMFVDGSADSLLASLPKQTLDPWSEPQPDFDFLIVGGAGIIRHPVISRYKVLNGHPGLLPHARGLDAFKWALLLDEPLGVSVHLIDPEVDAGWIVAQRPTPIFPWDSLETLAWRHFRNEMDLMVEAATSFDPERDYPAIEPEGEAHMRMPASKEEELVARFAEIKRRRAADANPTKA